MTPSPPSAPPIAFGPTGRLGTARPERVIVNIHASCVAAGTRGILLLGPSGLGKSDLALRLIERGARLVADDRCDLWVERGRLWCQPPAALAGKLEVRGVGIIDKPWTAPVPVAFAVRLGDRYERLPSGTMIEEVAGIALPAIKLSAFEASAPLKVLLALDAQPAT